MARITSKKRRIVVSLLSLSMMAQQTFVPMAVVASNITGAGSVHGDNITTGANGNTIFDLAPSAHNGDIGYRQYKNFNLSEGDIANLIFKYGSENVSKFVNFVDNTVNINGIVNTMRDGNFYDGKAVFISPNGVVVGASGVLNVGSLSVLTPSQEQYTKFKGNMYTNAPILAAEGTPEFNALMTDKGTGTIEINGKIVARDTIHLAAADVNVNSGANLMAGVKNGDQITSNAQADALFQKLVNTDAMIVGNEFQNVNGNIQITSYGSNGGVKIASNSVVKNFGAGNIDISSEGSKGVSIESGTVNSRGNTNITSEQGGVNISGSIRNANGELNITSNDGGINVTDSGWVNNINGDTNITSKGSGGIVVNNYIRTKNGNTTLKNEGTKGIEIVSGQVEADKGNLTIDNSASGGILIDQFEENTNNAVSNKNGKLTINNTGAGGITIKGNVYSDGYDSTITNTNGDRKSVV